MDHPGRMIGIGFVLVLLGAIFPFLMLLQVLQSTFFLNFFSYVASVMGLFLGVVGSAFYVRHKRAQRKSMFGQGTTGSSERPGLFHPKDGDEPEDSPRDQA